MIRKDLAMRKGKMIAQGSHGSFAAVLNQMKVEIVGSKRVFTLEVDVDCPLDRWLARKEGDSFKKICVYVKSEEELDNLYQAGIDAGLPCVLITDAGLTEFKGTPTKTCCVIGPGHPDEVDKITGDLPLL